MQKSNLANYHLKLYGLSVALVQYISTNQSTSTFLFPSFDTNSFKIVVNAIEAYEFRQISGKLTSIVIIVLRNVELSLHYM